MPDDKLSPSELRRLSGKDSNKWLGPEGKAFVASEVINSRSSQHIRPGTTVEDAATYIRGRNKQIEDAMKYKKGGLVCSKKSTPIKSR